jgi:hypothetical protein
MTPSHRAPARTWSCTTLGSGGWLIKRGDDMVATARFVSNPAALAVYAPAASDTARIDAKIP